MTADHLADPRQAHTARTPPPQHCDLADMYCDKAKLDLECIPCLLAEIKEELALIRLALEEREREKAENRKKLAGKVFGRGKIGSVNFSEPIDWGEALEKAAKAVGWSRPTYVKAKAVVEAAEAPFAPQTQTRPRRLG